MQRNCNRNCAVGWMMKMSRLKTAWILSLSGWVGPPTGSSFMRPWFSAGIYLADSDRQCAHFFIISRFIFLRYASALVKEGLKLLQCVIAVYYCAWMSKRLVQHGHWLPEEHWANFMNIPKMQYCTRANITVQLETNLMDFTIRPKILIYVNTLLHYAALCFFYFSALKKSYI